MNALPIVLLLFVALGSIEAAPTENDYCARPVSIRQAYNIGPHVYLAVSTQTIYRFDVTTKTFAPGKESRQTLFGDVFKWVDTVISFNEICRSAAYVCENSDEAGLDRVHLVIGQRANPKVYSFAVYDLDPVTGKLEVLEKPNLALVERLERLGISMKPDENGALPMDGPFWPSIQGRPYYQSGVFSPARGEFFFNVYDSNVKFAKNYLRRGRLGQNAPGIVYADENLSELYDNLGFVGMFRIADKTYGVDVEKVVYEIPSNNPLALIKKGKVAEFFDCFANSSRDWTGTASTTVSTTVAPPVVVTQAHKPDHQAKEVVFITKSPETNLAEHENAGKLDANEKEVNANRLDDGLMSDHPTGSTVLSNQSSPPSSPTDQSELAKADARGPFGEQDDGLLMLFACIIGGIISLSIVIMFIILICRHKSRSNRMYLNKKPASVAANGNGTANNANHNGANGLSEEQVQLMNSNQVAQ